MQRPDDSTKKETLFSRLTGLVSTIRESIDTTDTDRQQKLHKLITSIIDDAHQRINLFMNGLDENPDFSETDYLEKIDKLIEISGSAEFEPTEITRSDEWVINGKMIKHKQDKFLKIGFINCKATDSKRNERKWKQAIVIREFNQYDKHACDKIVGQMILPIRIHEGKLEAGITAKRPMGTLGQPSFFAPRWSNSSPTKQPALTTQGSIIKIIPMRGDSNRLTGVDETRITMFDNPQSTQLEDIVWFNTTELEHLIQNNLLQRQYLEDGITLALIYWVLYNKQSILTKIK